MREWRSYWRGKTKLDSADLDTSLSQVGKTTLGKPVAPEQVQLIVDRIRDALMLTPSDRVVDLGCGNGLLTVRVANLVKAVQGFDISPSLIASAQEFHGAGNCSYLVSDIVGEAWVPQLPPDVRKFYTYEVLQHLSTGEFTSLLTTLRRSRPEGFLLLAASVPDRSRLRAFYDTPERYALYERNVALGEEQIGHWWGRDELQEACSSLKLTCRFMEQDRKLYTAHYRFDVLISSDG
jgi:SAM-dependent methyltransferase